MALDTTPTFSITPSSTKTQTSNNYISVFDYSDQFDTGLHEQLSSIYGNQSITGLLYMMGDESSFESDQVIWTEEGRLHTVYKDVARAGSVFTKNDHVFRVNETIHISDVGFTRLGIITAVTTNTFTASAYATADFTALATTNLTVFVYGSEFRQGTDTMAGSLDSSLTILKNSPIIQKDKFEVSGSRVTQISWVKTSKGGYYWYLRSEEETRQRWEDRIELSMILAENAESGSPAETSTFKGTEGLFSAVRTRGNVFSGVASSLPDWDTILKRFDSQGKIQDYTFYVDRDQSLAIDDLLGTLNAGYDGGISYGLFDNDKDMAVNLGFTGFRRGGYNFFKTDWKLLNDPTLLGSVAVAADKVRGLLVPMGSKEVYDGEHTKGYSSAEKITVPFLQTMYRMAGAENRRYKTWVTGAVGLQAPTDGNDVMRVHHLSERMLNTTGANNFMLMEG